MMPLDEGLAALAHCAQAAKPRLFALYGAYDSGTPVLGWGMQCADVGAVYYEPHNSCTHIAKSAEDLRDRFAKYATVCLDWLS